MIPPEYLVVSAIISVVIRVLVAFGYLIPKDIDNDWFDEDGNFVPTEEFP
jgi:hypothetical protein